MFESAEYILRIILRLRDDASRKLAQVRAEVQGLENDIDGLGSKMHSLNTSMGTFADNVGDFESNLTRLRTVIHQIGEDEDFFDKMAESAERASEAMEKLGISRGRATGTVVVQGVAGGEGGLTQAEITRRIQQRQRESRHLAPLRTIAITIGALVVRIREADDADDRRRPHLSIS